MASWLPGDEARVSGGWRGGSEVDPRGLSLTASGPVFVSCRASAPAPGAARGALPAVRLPLDEQPADEGGAPPLHHPPVGHLPGELSCARPPAPPLRSAGAGELRLLLPVGICSVKGGLAKVRPWGLVVRIDAKPGGASRSPVCSRTSFRPRGACIPGARERLPWVQIPGFRRALCLSHSSGE